MAMGFDDLGLIPPQAVDLEEAVLSAILQSGNSYYDVHTYLKPESFYVQAHQIIYQAITELATLNKAIDILTVTDHLKKKKQLDEVGGPVFVTMLSSKISSPIHVVDHALIVRDVYVKRELIRISSDTQRKSFDGENESEDIISEIEAEIYSLSNMSTKRDPLGVTSGIREAIINMEAYQTGKIVGIKTGFSRLDVVTGGWQKQDLIIIGGRPSQGKTLLAIKHIMAAAKSGIPTLFFSLEMSQMSISTRMICMETGISNDDIRNGLSDIQWNMVEGAISRIEKLPIFIDDTGAISLMDIRSKARRAKLKHNIGLIVIDYLGLMDIGKQSKQSTRDLDIGFVTRGLKALAKELDIPIILLCQLNRATEMHRSDPRPRLINLRESGNIEQDADLVIFIHRPEYYFKPDSDTGVESCVGELIVAKHRNGRLEDIKFRRRENFSDLMDY